MEKWNITITAPTGDFDAVLEISGGNEDASGEMVGKNGRGPMTALVVDNSAIAWSSKIERPMPMTLKFRGTRDSQIMSGTVKFGIFASGTFNGSRVA